MADASAAWIIVSTAEVFSRTVREFSWHTGFFSSAGKEETCVADCISPATAYISPAAQAVSPTAQVFSSPVSDIASVREIFSWLVQGVFSAAEETS